MFKLKYCADWRSLFFLLLALCAVYVPFFYSINSYLIIPWIYLSSWLCTLAMLINHNHQHCATFTHKKTNFFFDLLITAVIGYPSCDIYRAHNQNHHVYLGGNKDWAGVHVAGLGYGFERLLRYALVAIGAMKKAQRQPDTPSRPTRIELILKIERFFIIGLIVWLLYFDWAAFVLFMLLPNLLATQRLLEYNHILHDNGCDFSKIETCSHNVTSKLANWFYLNAGLHTAHHLQPGLHWSLLPEVHQQIKRNISDSYLHHSAMAFYFRYLASKKYVLN